MTTKPLELKRGAYGLVAAALTMVVVAASLMPGFANAAQLTSRSVKLSDSSVSGGVITTGVGSGTNVAAAVGFTVDNAAVNLGGIVIDFCSNSPLIGDSCTAPTNFNVNAATTSLNGQTNISGFAIDTTNSTANKIIITNATPAPPTGAAVGFELGDGSTNGLTNPNSNGPLYARIYTYTTEAAAQAHNTGTPTGYTDFGGIAMSINQYVTITAKVMESLTFCASKDDVSGTTLGVDNCADATTPSVIIGHGGPPATLDANAVDTATVFTQISTNATSGAAVRMRATNTCSNGGLSSTGGAVCNIPGINTGTTPAPMIAGTAGFGLFVSASSTTAGVSTSSGTVNPDLSYHDPAHVTETGTPDLYYGMDTSTVGDNVTTTYGDKIMSCAGPVSQVNNHLVFAATASLTTQAGIYTGNEVLIATGTF